MGGTGNSIRTRGIAPIANIKGGSFSPPPTEKSPQKPGEKREKGGKKEPVKKPVKSEFTKKLEAKEKAKWTKLKGMNEAKKTERQYIAKKARQYYKKTGATPKTAQQKKWKQDFKKYQANQAARQRADVENLFGKMTDTQYKAHLAKRMAARAKKAATEKFLKGR